MINKNQYKVNTNRVTVKGCSTDFKKYRPGKMVYSNIYSHIQMLLLLVNQIVIRRIWCEKNKKQQNSYRIVNS